MVAGHFTYNILCSSCVVSNAVFLIQLIGIRLYHVDEVCDDFFLFNGYRFEVFHYRISQLSFVHVRPRRHFVVPLVPPQRVHLELVEVNFGKICVGLIAVLLRVLSSPLRPCALDSHLVEVANVNVLRIRINAEFESSLSYSFLNPLAVRGISCGIPAAITVINQTTNLICGPARVLLARTEAVVHFTLFT